MIKVSMQVICQEIDMIEPLVKQLMKHTNAILTKTPITGTGKN